MTALDVKTQKRILEDVLAGKSEDGYSPSESAFRGALEKDVEAAKKNGWVLEIPAEWEIQ